MSDFLGLNDFPLIDIVEETIKSESLIVGFPDIRYWVLQEAVSIIIHTKLTNNLLQYRLMVFGATFNDISVISWRSVILVEEIGVSGENHRPVASHWQTLSHNFVSSTHNLSGVRTYNRSGDGNDCIGRCLSNYHTVTTTTVPTSIYTLDSIPFDLRLIPNLINC